MDNQPTATSPNSETPGERPHKSRGVRWLVWAVILVSFGLIFWWVWHSSGGSQASPSPRGGGGPVTINTATAKQGNIGVYLNAIGTVTPVYTASITSQVTGLVREVHYKEGQLVHKGDPLIEIDSRQYEAQLMQAQGALDRDTHILEQARMDLERYREAWARNGIPKQTLDDQEKVALQDEGTVKIDQGTVAYDKVQVSYCHITAPITGRVGLRLVDPGNVVQANGTTPLAVITQMQPITVVFTIAEGSLAQVRAQMRKGKTLAVEALDSANTAKLATGKLLTVDNQIDTTTGTVKLRASFDNKNEVLFPNQFVNARLLVNTLPAVTLVPTSAIQHNGPASFVYVITSDTAHMRNVKPGVADGGNTAIEGLNPGEVVANSSFEKLQENSKIVVSKPPAPAATSGGPAP